MPALSAQVFKSQSTAVTILSRLCRIVFCIFCLTLFYIIWNCLPTDLPSPLEWRSCLAHQHQRQPVVSQISVLLFVPYCHSHLYATVTRCLCRCLLFTSQIQRTRCCSLVIASRSQGGSQHGRVTFSAWPMGLHQRKRACSGLGLDLAGDQSPSPAYRLASPFVGLASQSA
jgi:hypothetical protein